MTRRRRAAGPGGRHRVPGAAFGAEGETFGEAVFNTGMCGYQEVLTDPSYARQIVTMTAPHQGNYGVNPEDAESERRAGGGVRRPRGVAPGVVAGGPGDARRASSARPASSRSRASIPGR